jgi:class 3 adenylate cyclase
VAHWLADSGFTRTAVLAGGLAAWRAAGLPMAGADDGARDGRGGLAPRDGPRDVLASFLPSLAERYRTAGTLPTRRRLTTLYVDIAGSTRLLARNPPEEVLNVVQRFLGLVTEVALAYCGDVKDYEGDGALLYFESTAEAVRAALAIRAALAGGWCDARCEHAPRIEARMSLTVGDVVIGVVGTAMRRAIALVGPSVSVGSRLLKQVSPGGIIASGEVVDGLGETAPDLAAEFTLVDPAFAVPGADGITVATWVVADGASPAPTQPARPASRAARDP